MDKKVEKIFENVCIDEICELSMIPVVTTLMTRDPHFDLQYDYEEESAEIPVCRRDFHASGGRHSTRAPGSLKVRTDVAEANWRFKAHVNIWDEEEPAPLKIKIRKFNAEDTGTFVMKGFARDLNGNLLPTENDHLCQDLRSSSEIKRLDDEEKERQDTLDNYFEIKKECEVMTKKNMKALAYQEENNGEAKVGLISSESEEVENPSRLSKYSKPSKVELKRMPINALS
jgi:hypothetical protein